MKKEILFLLAIVGGFLNSGASEIPVSSGNSAFSAPRDTVQLEELSVLGIKQQGILATQPVSASVFNIEQIQLNNILALKSISDMAPNVYIPNYGSRITSSIYVRGIGARMDHPAVGLNIDNLPVLNKDAYDLDIPDIDVIEMLRGPQAVLYGRNTMAGLIDIKTISPMRWQGLRLMAEMPGPESFIFQGGWYHKFNHKTAFSVNAAIGALQGRYFNSFNRKPVGTEQSGSVRMKFEWQPRRNISILNTLSANLMRQNGYPYASVKTGKISYNDTCFYNRFLINDALTLKFTFPGWTLTSISSLQHLDDNMTLDQDFLPEPYFTLTQKKYEIDVTEEVLAQRTGKHLYNWLAGFFGFYRHLDMDAPVHFKDIGIRELIEKHRNEANPFYPIRWDSRKFALNSHFRLPAFGLAVYHESRFSFGPWNINAGIRLDYEKVFLDYHSHTSTSYTTYDNSLGNADTPFDQMGIYRHNPVDLDLKGKVSTDFLTLLPKISVLYSLGKDMGNVYASFGKGYKAGGFNTQMFSDVLQQSLMEFMGLGSKYTLEQIVKYKPEFSYNYEIGSHLDFSKLSSNELAKLKLDLALFYIDCFDQQLTVFPDGNTTGRIMTNAGKTRSFGFEASAFWNPWSPLQFNLSYGYTNARFVEFNNGIEDFAGKVVPYAPQFTYYAQGLYTYKAKWLRQNALVFDLNVKGVGKIYWNEANSLSQNPYLLLGASVMLKSPKWEVQIWGRNLTGTRYSVFYFMSMGNEFLQRGEKLLYGATLRLFI